jgi:hypothetical protein
VNISGVWDPRTVDDMANRTFTATFKQGGSEVVMVVRARLDRRELTRT